MSQHREFEPLPRGTWTAANALVLLGIFTLLVTAAVVALMTDQDWWVAPAFFAVVVGVVAPIAFVAGHYGTSHSLVVTPDAVELVKGGRRSTGRTVVRRDVEGYRAAFAQVLRGWTTNVSDPILVLTDGREIISVHRSWGAGTQRAIAAELGVERREKPTRRFELMASVGIRSPFAERRPFVFGLLLALSVVVVVFAVAAAAGLID